MHPKKTSILQKGTRNPDSRESVSGPSLYVDEDPSAQAIPHLADHERLDPSGGSLQEDDTLVHGPQGGRQLLWG